MIGCSDLFGDNEGNKEGVLIKRRPATSSGRSEEENKNDQSSVEEKTDVYSERSWLEQEKVVRDEVHGRTHIPAMPWRWLGCSQHPRGWCSLRQSAKGPREAKIESSL